MNILKKHTTSEGSELEFVTFEHSPNSIFVIDNSCQMERKYTLGSRNYLSFDDYDKPTEDITMITDFQQVIDAWCNEEMHF